MVDDKKAPDEYQYPPDEYYKGGEYIPPGEEHESLEPEPMAKGPLVPRKILYLLGFLLAIGLVYLIISFSNARKSAELSQPTSLDTSAATIPSTSTGETTAIPQGPTQPIAPMDSATSNSIANLNAQNQANQQAISSLQSQIQQLQTQLNTLTNSISSLNSQIQVIVNEVRGIGLERATAGRNINLPAGVTYHLKALVPGRAWLQAKNGVTKTILLGTDCLVMALSK